MASTRLPNKVMRPLGDKTVLSHVLERCLAIEGIDAVCCATTDGADCDPIAIEAEAAGATVFRGDESDVLKRYFDANSLLQADVVMRVTSDCPLLDPVVAANVLRPVVDGDADYTCNNIPPSWPHGLDCEAFTAQWLEKAHLEAVRPFEREHMSLYIRSHPDTRMVNIPSPDETLSKHRWTLDTPQDWVFLEKLFEYFPAGHPGFGFQKILEILHGHPELFELNAHQDRFETIKKALAEESARGN
jgi:spore coat polysaccharide biosynthesis protein SpsF